jgi:hypothetical protein
MLSLLAAKSLQRYPAVLSDYDLPNYPDARHLEGYVTTRAGYYHNPTREVHFSFWVPDTTPEEVFSYYRRHLPEKGWSERGRIIYENEDELLRFAQRGPHLLDIRVSHLKTSPQGASSVALTLF